MRVMMFVLAASVAAPAFATDKAEIERQCQFQADVLGAVQQARLDRVRKDDAADAVRAANPDWPDSLEGALAPVVEYVYGFKRRELRELDLAGSTKQTCIENWDQMQALKNAVTN